MPVSFPFFNCCIKRCLISSAVRRPLSSKQLLLNPLSSRSTSPSNDRSAGISTASILCTISFSCSFPLTVFASSDIFLQSFTKFDIFANSTRIADFTSSQSAAFALFPITPINDAAKRRVAEILTLFLAQPDEELSGDYKFRNNVAYRTSCTNVTARITLTYRFLTRLRAQEGRTAFHSRKYSSHASLKNLILQL